MPNGSRFAGLYARDARLYAEQDGRYDEVYVDKTTQTVRLQPSSGVRSLFYDPELRRNADGDWKMMDVAKLKGGGRAEVPDGNKPGPSASGAGQPARRPGLSNCQQGLLADLEKLDDEWKNV